MAQTCALIAPVQPILHRVSCTKQTMQNAPKHYETYQNMSFWSNGVDRVRSLRKIPMRLRGTNFSMIAPVRPILYRVSCSNETIQNAPKHYKTHQYMSLGSNGVHQVRSLRKSLMRLHGTNFCINCTCSTRLRRVSCSNETLPNAPKYYETHQNKSLGSNGVGQVHLLRKIPKRLHGTNLCINCTSSTRFATSFV